MGVPPLCTVPVGPDGVPHRLLLNGGLAARSSPVAKYANHASRTDNPTAGNGTERCLPSWPINVVNGQGRPPSQFLAVS